MTKTASKQGVVGNIHTLIPISADEKGTLPTELELLQVGMWDSPTHGMFMVTPEDLDEYIEHFTSDIRPSSSTMGLPIDFRHDREGPAAAWIKKVYLAPSSNEDGTNSLWGGLKWSDQGATEVQGGRWKFFSPEFCPRGRGGFVDPEGVYYDIENVLMGGGLTNRPLFKGLKPVAASESGSANSKKMLYISSSEKEQKMNLKDLLAKDQAEWTEAERQFVADHKSELSDDDKKKFGFDDKKEEPKKDDDKKDEPAKDPVTPPAAPVAASEGQVVVSASEFNKLKETAQDYRREKAEQFVDKQIERGAIKSDQKENWTNQLLASEGDARKNLEGMLESLPASTVLASEQGSTAQAATVGSAQDELDTEAKKIVSASEGKVTLSEAYKKVQDDNTDLRDRVNAERKTQAVA